MRDWAIEARPKRVLAGRASISRSINPAPPGVAELQIVSAKDFWGQQLGREIAAILIPIAFDERRAVAIVAYVHPDNHASLRLLDAFGFVQCDQKKDGERLILELDRLTYKTSLQGVLRDKTKGTEY